MTVIDTDFLVALDHRRPGAVRMADEMSRQPAPVLVPAAAWMEYLVGVATEARPATVAGLLRAASFQAFGRAEAEEGVRIQDELRALGKPLAWHDLQVAATARSLGEPLVSNDQAFRHVPRLDVTPF